jgi:hypothetical protein
MNAEKFALVIAERPHPEDADHPDKRWQSFLDSIPQNVPPVEGIQRFHENVWQIPLNTGFSFLCELHGWAGSVKVPLHILFLEVAPDWITCPPDAPKTA